jgi:hypothetical protein
MTLKNKITLGFEGLIKSAEQKGGIPDRIELPPKEAYELLRELRNVEKVRKDYTFDQEDGMTEIEFRLFGKTPSNEELTAFANDWYKGKIRIKFKDIPLKIVVPPEPKKEPDTRFRRKLKPVR